VQRFGRAVGVRAYTLRGVAYLALDDVIDDDAGSRVSECDDCAAHLWQPAAGGNVTCEDCGHYHVFD